MRLPRSLLRRMRWLAFPALLLLAWALWRPSSGVNQSLLNSGLSTGASSAKPGLASPRRAYRARKLCDLSDKRIDESSGMGASRAYPSHLWTHNDSEDKPRLFLITLQGQTVAVVRLEGAKAEDWEDMAVAGRGRDAWVYVGDIGDNEGSRPSITICRFREPTLDLHHAPQITAATVVPWEQMTLTYPDSAHDAETLLATSDGYLIIVTKALDQSLIFMTPQPFKANTTQKLVKVGTYSFGDVAWPSRLATGGDLSPDGKRLVVRTYTRAYEWDLPQAATSSGIATGTRPPRPGEARLTPWRALWKRAPQKFTLPPTVQGEAICYGVDGRRLFTTSEKRPTPLYELAQQ